VKIKSVHYDNRRKAFDVATSRKTYCFPYAKLDLRPSRENPIASVAVDEELGNEAFTYSLASGEEGTVHLEQVLDYNRDPRYLRDLLLYKLTLAARERVQSNSLSMRELARRLGTSPAQLYRLLDPTNYAKSIDQLTALLSILDCEIDLIVRRNRARPAVATSVS
jgi:AraC-like DNA-binding protein